MNARISLWSGLLLLLLCGAAPAPAVPPSPHPKPTQARPAHAAIRPHHAQHHRRRHVVVASESLLTPQLNQVRTQVAETVALLGRVEDDLHGQSTQARADAAQVAVRLDNQGRQTTLLAKRVDALDGRVDAMARDRQADTSVIERHQAEQDARLDAQSQRVAALAADRPGWSPVLALALAALALLTAAGAIVLGFFQRAAAVTEAETHADRLFQTYGAEFNLLAQAARELEARLHGTPAPHDSLDMPLRGQPAASR